MDSFFSCKFYWLRKGASYFLDSRPRTLSLLVFNSTLSSAADIRFEGSKASILDNVSFSRVEICKEYRYYFVLSLPIISL